MMRMGKKRRILGWLLTVCLLFAQIPLTVFAAESTVSEVMRLAGTEGTVAVATQNGKDIKVISDMKLYSGYHISTEEDGVAYISLDSTKVLKLGSSSEAEVRKSGKRLEIMLVSGDLFFNVKKPLEEDESMNVRTSTMVTGIRGTSGIMSTSGADLSSLMLLDGEVTVQGINPSNGRTVYMVVNAGRKITVRTGPAEGGNQVNLSSEEVLESEILPFAGVEVAKDPQLQQRIQRATNLNVPQIVSGYEDAIRREETVRTDNNPGALSHGGSAADPEDPTNQEEPESPGVPAPPGETDEPVIEPGSSVTIPGDDLTENNMAETLEQAFSENYKVVINGGRFHIMDDIAVPENRTLEISAEVINDAALTIGGTLKIGNYFENNSDVQVRENAAVLIDTAKLFENKGKIVNEGEFLNSGIFQSEPLDGRAVSDAPSFVNRGALVNHGLFQTTVIGTGSGTDTEIGSFSNEGQIENHGQFQIGASTNFDPGDPSQWSCEEGILYRPVEGNDYPEDLKELAGNIMDNSAILVRVDGVAPTGERIYGAGSDLQWMINKFNRKSVYLEDHVTVLDQTVTVPAGGTIDFYMDGYTMTMDGGKIINKGSLGFKSGDWDDQRGNGLDEASLKGANTSCLIDNRKTLTLSNMKISLESSGDGGGTSYAIKNSSTNARIIPTPLTDDVDSLYYRKAALTVENFEENGWALYNAGGVISLRDSADTETSMSFKSVTSGHTVNDEETEFPENSDMSGYYRNVVIFGKREWSPSKSAVVSRRRRIATPPDAIQEEKENKTDGNLPAATPGNASKGENKGDKSGGTFSDEEKTDGLKVLPSAETAIWKEEGDNEFTSPA